jgi:Nif-specific regulatory protein
VELVLPQLRERGAEDIERLTRHFLAAAAKKHRIDPAPRLSAAAVDLLNGYRWPGNVRELENCIESAVVLCEGEILPEHLPLPSAQRSPAADGKGTHPTGTQRSHEEGALLTLAEAERRHICAVLEAVEGNRTAAAKALGIGRNTLGRKLKEYGLGEE